MTYLCRDRNVTSCIYPKKDIMKNLLYLLLAACCVTCLHAQSPDRAYADSLAVLASRSDVAKLRPLFRQSAALLPPETRLYCEVVLARDEGNDARMKECIDSLTQQYGRRLDPAGRTSLVALKSEVLMREGRFDEMRTYLTEQQQYAKKRKYSTENLSVIARYLHKAESLSDASPRGNLLRLAAQDDPFRLLAAYRRQSNALDDYARLVVRLKMAEAFGRRTTAGTCAERLLTNYADSLLPTERADCFTACAEDFVWRGEWKALGEFLKSHDSIAALNTSMAAYYKALAGSLAQEPVADVERSGKDAAVRLSRDWPLMLPATLNGKATLHMVLDTERRHTLLTEADAKAAGLKVLDVTVTLPLSGQMVETRPAFVRSLQLGGLTLKNILVYVVRRGAVADDAFARVLGTDDLLRAEVIELRDEKMVFPVPMAREALSAPDLCMTESGALQAETEGSDAQRFYLSTLSPDSWLTTLSFPRETTDTADFRLRLDGHERHVPAPDFYDNPGGGAAGVLGAKFLRSFTKVRLDFLKMQMTMGQQQDYTPHYVADYAVSGDLMTLERNAAALSATTDATNRDLMRLLILHGKNMPANVTDLAKRLESAFSEEGMEEERYVVGMEEAQALAQQGKYDAAAAVCRKLHQSGDYNGDMQAEAAARAQIFTAARSFGAPTLQAPVTRTAVRYDKDGETVEGLLNGKACNLRIDPTEPYTLIPEKLAKKMKVSMLYTSADYSVGIAGSITIGQYTLKNVLCRLAPDEERTVTVGYNTLCLVPRVTLGAEGIMLSTEQPQTDAAQSGLNMRYDDHLFVEGETATGYVTLRLTPTGSNTLRHRAAAPVRLGALTLPASQFVPVQYADYEDPYAGTVSLTYLLQHLRTLTFDFRHMRLH